MSPALEGVEDGEELFVVSVVIEFWGGQRAGCECNGSDFGVRTDDGEDGGDSVVGGVSFYDELLVRHVMSKYWSSSESLFYLYKSGLHIGVPLP